MSVPLGRQQCGIFILGIFHVTGTLLSLDPGLIREAKNSKKYLLNVLILE